MIYTNVLSAVVSALAAECIDNTSKQAWQRLYQAGEGRPVGPAVSEDDRLLADCWVFARLHTELLPRHWDVLVARYSTHAQKKARAITELVPLIASHAGARFVERAVATWAIPKLKGEQQSESAAVVDKPKDGEPEWRKRAAALNAERATRHQEAKAGRSSVMIILPASWYDMNLWDEDANTDRTRQRWRKAIYDTLNEMVREALAAAEQILKEEGLLLDHAA